MIRTRLFVAATAAALLSACGMGVSYPEFAEADYRIEGMTADPNGGAATQTVIYRDGPKMRVEAMLPRYGQATIVFDEASNAAYVLTSAQGVTTMTPAPTTGAAPSATTPSAQPATPGAAPTTTAQNSATTPAPAAPATAGAAQVAGVAVRLDEADAPQPMEQVWAALGEDNARRVGNCEVAGERGNEWRPRDESAGVERTACITDDGIVLRVREDNVVLWEATSLQRGQQDAALFGVPPGYQLIDPEAVAEGVGERMEQLDSVTGDGAQPQQQQPAPRQPG
jgi:hypothetical protein